MHRLMLIFAILLNSASYFYIALPACMRDRAICFGGADIAPVKYRVLQPALERLIADGSQEGVLLADFALQALLTVVIIAGLYSWLRRWVNEDRALVGVLLFDLMMVGSYHFFLRALSSTIELACIVGALWLLPRWLFSPA